MDMEHYMMQMVKQLNIMDNGSKTREMDKDKEQIVMVIYIKVIGKQMNSMEEVL